MPTHKLSPTRKVSHILSIALVLATLTFNLASSAHAQTETVLYNFSGGANGSLPRGGVIFDTAGNLYGTTQYGGGTKCDVGCGTVFELSPISGGGWTQTVLHTFTGGRDGADPYATLVSDGLGNLYGTASLGGNLAGCGGQGCGVVFELSPSSGGWTETVLHAFSGGRDGAQSWTSLIFDSAGNLYGTTTSGGNLTAANCAPYGCGVIFELSPVSGGWKETVLHAFSGGRDGAFPFGNLTFDAAGNLYGTTTAGGNVTLCGGGCGVVFKLSRVSGGWQETALHTFSGNDGSDPQGGVTFDAAGNLYGTAAVGGEANGCDGEGCGTAFKLSPTTSGPWTATALHVFKDTAFQSGFYPSGSLLPDSAGNLYGVTGEGGTFGYGVVFKLSLVSGVWKETVLHAFNFTGDVAVPFGGLTFDASGNLYGTAESGGTHAPNGGIFEITP
jgi:uncharacterized repeat protein (TIGR03803 family)